LVSDTKKLKEDTLTLSNTVAKDNWKFFGKEYGYAFAEQLINKN